MRGFIKKRGKAKDKWTLYASHPTERYKNGNPKQVTRTVTGSKKDAERELTKFLTEMDNRSYVPTSKMTVREFLLEWLRDYAKPHVQPNTYALWEGIVRNHLIPGLGHLRLTELEPPDIDVFYSKLARAKKPNGSRLAPLTVLHVHQVLHVALENAVRRQRLIRNPANAKLIDRPKATQGERNTLSKEEVVRLFDVVRGHKYEIPVVLACAAALRRGEVYGLTWRDIDFGRNTLHVRHSMEETTEYGLRLKGTKTTKGRRSIPLLDITIEPLLRHRETQVKQKEQLGEGYKDNGLIMAELDGRPSKPYNLSSWFPKVLSKAGLPKVTFHDLRHTAATLMLQAGIPMKVVQEVLGHSTIKITMDLYSHVTPPMLEETKQKMNDFWRPQEEQKDEN